MATPDLFAQSSGDRGNTWTTLYPCHSIESAVRLADPQQDMHQGRIVVRHDDGKEEEFFAPLTEDEISYLEELGIPRTEE